MRTENKAKESLSRKSKTQKKISTWSSQKVSTTLGWGTIWKIHDNKWIQYSNKSNTFQHLPTKYDHFQFVPAPAFQHLHHQAQPAAYGFRFRKLCEAGKWGCICPWKKITALDTSPGSAKGVGCWPSIPISQETRLIKTSSKTTTGTVVEGGLRTVYKELCASELRYRSL